MPTNMEGTRPLTGPALPNLINAVSMLKSKSKPSCRSDRPRSPATPDGGTAFDTIENRRATGDGRPYGDIFKPPPPKTQKNF